MNKTETITSIFTVAAIIGIAAGVTAALLDTSGTAAYVIGAVTYTLASAAGTYALFGGKEKHNA